jgi:paraquat-inducible protein B
MPDRDPPIPSAPDSRAVPKKQTRLSPVWLIPILAAALGVWVAVARIRSEGPKITIVFQSAEGLEAGKTKINYRGVDVGTIKAIRLSRDHQRVIATAQMTPKTEEFLAEDTIAMRVFDGVAQAAELAPSGERRGYTANC